MRWWRGLVWALDLVDPKGNPDFGKFMQAGTQLVLLALLWRSEEVPFGLALLLVVGAHGTRTLLAAMKLKVFSFGRTETVVETVSHSITERRDPAAGVDPSP